MTTSQIDDTRLDRPTEPSLDQLAAKYFGAETVPVRGEFGALSHRGLVRSNNEDHYSVVRRYRSREVLLTNMPAVAYPQRRDEAYALAVADGVGGAAFGELASMLALRTGWELTGTAFKWNFNLSETEIADMEEGMNVYMQLIHRRLKEEAEVNASYKGMGTTLTGALTVGLDAFIVHVGDSRAYLYRQGTLHRLTKDQTLAELMASLGLVATVDEAAQRFRNTLISCLGGNFDKVEVETTHVTMQDGDQLLLCTDGLTDMVGDADIASILAHSSTPQARCQELIDAALAGGGRDNVTVVLGRYSIGA
ncbi:MAG: serine/threonine-protein phosphatase [Candidatus Saccharimonas sp.]|nr:serine/threonine-protein phosphatase [Planctomycetaceae bacterium]